MPSKGPRSTLLRTGESMKQSAISRCLVPVKEFRANLAEGIGRLDQDGRLIVITQR